MKKIILILLIILVGFGGGMLLKNRRQQMVKAPKAVPLTYTVHTVMPRTKTIFQTTPFLARMESENPARISTKISARIKDLAVVENQPVLKGAWLVHLDDREIQAGIKGIQAKLVAAVKQQQYAATIYKRNMALYQAGGLSKEKLEASQVTLTSATAQVKELKQNMAGLKNQLTYCHIKAPFSGVVGTIFLRRGSLALPGQPILTFNALSQKLTFNFMPGPAPVTPGQTILVAGRQAGTITTLYSDAKNGLTVAQVKLAHPLDQPFGSFLTIEVVTSQATGCSVPCQALVHRKKGIVVMAFVKDHFEAQPVTVQIQDQSDALISPCPNLPVAVASEAKLTLLPTYGSVRIIQEKRHE